MKYLIFILPIAWILLITEYEKTERRKGSLEKGGWWDSALGKEYIPSAQELSHAKRKKTISYLMVVLGFITITLAIVGIISFSA